MRILKKIWENKIIRTTYKKEGEIIGEGIGGVAGSVAAGMILGSSFGPLGGIIGGIIGGIVYGWYGRFVGREIGKDFSKEVPLRVSKGYNITEVRENLRKKVESAMEKDIESGFKVFKKVVLFGPTICWTGTKNPTLFWYQGPGVDGDASCTEEQ